ncbi:glycoside hydrolase [Meredithblackwellia eburnea MCA 4105]
MFIPGRTLITTCLALSNLVVPAVVAATHNQRFRRVTRHSNATTTNHLEKRALSSPQFVLYSDRWTNMGSPPAASEIAGYTIFALSFWLTYGPADMAQGVLRVVIFVTLSLSVKAEYAAAGIKLIVAAFGATDTPTSSGGDPTPLANNLATFVKTYDLDGADIDYEDFSAMSAGTAEQWLITFTTQLRSQLPSPYIISHAPVAPWFTDSTSLYPGGGYLKVNSAVGDKIDLYNTQFYNQGTSEYTDCSTLLTKSNAFPHSSLFEIIANGVSKHKLIIGKPAIAADAVNGFITPSQLGTCVSQARAQGWDAGLMLWQYPDQPNGFIQTAWGSVSSSPGSSTTTTTTTSKAISTTSKSTSLPITTTPTKTTSGPAPTGTNAVNCDLPISKDGAQCGPSFGVRCSLTSCCSSSGYCGVGDAWCGAGCQFGFGNCNAAQLTCST